jgi:hypothetical protein
VLEVLGCVGNGCAGPVREHLDAPIPLGELPQQLQAQEMRHGLRDGRELGEQNLFGALA